MRTVGIREWQQADSLNRVHWKATARHQQLLSRVYEPSEDPQMLIFLNVATMARYWQGVLPEMQEFVAYVRQELHKADNEGWEERLEQALIKLPPSAAKAFGLARIPRRATATMAM